MGLEGPWLTTTGKKKGKTKFKNAAAASKAREDREAWDALKKKWNVSPTKKKKIVVSKPAWIDPVVHRGEGSPRIPSLPCTGEPCTKNPVNVYTGNSMVGIVVQHKSCLQPVFNQEAAVDSAKMRR